jgi:hypothetical protein
VQSERAVWHGLHQLANGRRAARVDAKPSMNYDQHAATPRPTRGRQHLESKTVARQRGAHRLSLVAAREGHKHEATF